MRGGFASTDMIFFKGHNVFYPVDPTSNIRYPLFFDFDRYVYDLGGIMSETPVQTKNMITNVLTKNLSSASSLAKINGVSERLFPNDWMQTPFDICPLFKKLSEELNMVGLEDGKHVTARRDGWERRAALMVTNFYELLSSTENGPMGDFIDGRRVPRWNEKKLAEECGSFDFEFRDLLKTARKVLEGVCRG